MKKLVLSLLIALLPSVASAEIVKSADIDCKGICFHWWPKLQPPQGWHQDTDMSYRDNINALAPDGHTFGDAEAVMYGNAVYKPRVPEDKSIDQFVQGDKERFASEHPKSEMKDAEPLTTADGKSLRSVIFVEKNDGYWERVSYGEEGDFYLVFTLSSRSQKGYDETMSAYEKLVESYREK
jgi:hypothetical protein